MSVAQVWLQRLGAGASATSPLDDPPGCSAAAAAALLRIPRDFFE